MSLTCADRGGSFTDLVFVDPDGTARLAKVPSDRAVLGSLAQGRLVFGTTVVTNALLTSTAASVLLIVAEGMEDLCRIGDMTRPELFDPDAAPRSTLATRVIGIGGRLDADGRELEPLVLPERWPLDGIEAVAVALPHSGRDGRHEREVARAVRAARPDLYVALGSELAPEVGLLARLETALVDAALTPLLRRALAADRVGPDALALRSDGSLVPAAALRAPDALLSGPAAGALAVASIGRMTGRTRLIGLDMGGTSTDLVVFAGALPLATAERRIAGIRVRRPALRIETIAAGGGSVVRVDGRTLRVGPESAGADPGPQCIGRGGPPTVTDAAVALGLVDASAFDPPLRPDLVDLPVPPTDAVDLCREHMAAALRRAAAEGGHDPAEFALVAYGGAAGQHAAEVAARVGIREVLVHPAASVLSAWGLTGARRQEAASAPIWSALPDGFGALEVAWRRLAAPQTPLGPVRRSATCRLRGTDTALEVEGADAEALDAAFRAAHREALGSPAVGVVEVVDALVRASEPERPPARVDDDPWQVGDSTVVGPSLIRCPTTSVAVPAGWSARRQQGLLVLTGPPTAPSTEGAPSPHALAVWSSRFEACAEEAGAVLVRLARSVNIRERRDFSVGLFDRDGRLVAHAPHVPVHLGAMGETVRDLLSSVPDLPDGVSWLCNHPAAGGSHLPDLTVTTPVRHDGARWFVASRAHHVDVGGLTPGSMPPRASHLHEEGVAVRHVRLDGPLDAFLPFVRDPATVSADLRAQVAANGVAAGRLRALGPAVGVERWMGHLRAAARDSVADWLDLREGHAGTARDDVDGVSLQVRLEARGRRLAVDFSGTAGPHRGNLNAPRAVTRAAVLYALRVAVGRPFPLNEGALDPVDLLIPRGCILDPPEGAAVAGGNVETSQRVVDLLLGLLTGRAAGQGTMNNLTLGGDGWSFYETIGGGQGASAMGPGLSGLQVHLTNTRTTDAEVLEHRLPLRLVRFALRPGSGGDGLHRGGDGLVREIELRAPGTAALLAARRPPPGAAGGGPGRLGSDAIRRSGVWSAWDGAPVHLEAGDRVRVETPGGGGWGAAR